MPFQEAIFTRRIMPQPHSYLQERFCRGFMNFSSFFVCYHKQLQFLRVDRVDRLCDPIAGHRRLSRTGKGRHAVPKNSAIYPGLNC